MRSKNEVPIESSSQDGVPPGDSSGTALPRLSIMVCVCEMDSVIANTLHSLSVEYQHHVDAIDYEVVVVDYGLSVALDPTLVPRDSNMRLVRIEPSEIRGSPVNAVNEAVAMTRGDSVGVITCGARIVTPGLIHNTLDALAGADDTVVVTLGWDLGHDVQNESMQHGHDHEREERLLRDIGWPSDGYRLFEIGTLDEPSSTGWFTPVDESSALFMKRDLWSRLGGFGSPVASAGTGYGTGDSLEGPVDIPQVRVILLIGEATFHQSHKVSASGGRSSSSDLHPHRWTREARGERWIRRRVVPYLYGATPDQVKPHVAMALARSTNPPLDTRVWRPLQRRPVPTAAPRSPSDRLVELAHRRLTDQDISAAAAAARLGHARDSEHTELRRLSSLLAGCHPHQPGVGDLLALGDAHLTLGEPGAARECFARALAMDSSNDAARIRLARLNMPGPTYLDVLRTLHTLLRPDVYLELGVSQGASLALARPPTRAFGVDPAPKLRCELATETSIFPVPTDDFFSRHHPDIEGRVALAFVDGYHEVTQVFRDVANLSRLMKPTGVVAIHDTVPFDEMTARRERASNFWTGDVWKIVPLLHEVAPQVRVAILPTSPSGLTLLAGLSPIDPGDHSDTVKSWVQADFAAYTSPSASQGENLPNDVEAIRDWLAIVSEQAREAE